MGKQDNYNKDGFEVFWNDFINLNKTENLQSV